jgi:hypothetical protein
VKITPFAPTVAGVGVWGTVVLMHFSNRAVSAFGTTPCRMPGTEMGAAPDGVPSTATAKARHAAIPRDLTTPTPMTAFPAGCGVASVAR